MDRAQRTEMSGASGSPVRGRRQGSAARTLRAGMVWRGGRAADTFLHVDDRSLDDATGTLEIPAGRLTASRVTDASGI